jgi:hypothetical protein
MSFALIWLVPGDHGGGLPRRLGDAGAGRQAAERAGARSSSLPLQMLELVRARAQRRPRAVDPAQPIGHGRALMERLPVTLSPWRGFALA